MRENDWFVMRPQKAQIYSRPEPDGFFVRKGSTAMLKGSPRVKRDREERDRLIKTGVLVPDRDPDLLRFERDHFSKVQAWQVALSMTATATARKAGEEKTTEERSRRSLEDYHLLCSV